MGDEVTKLETLESSVEGGKKIPEEKIVKFDPSVIQLAEIIKQGFLENRGKELEELKIEAKDRFYISVAIVCAIVVIIIAVGYLTLNGKFDTSTLAFMLGASIGSLLTILGKHLTGGE